MTGRENLLSPRDAASALGVSQATIYALVAAKAISHVRLGLGRGKIAFSEAHLLEYLRRNEVRAVVPPAPHQPLPDWFLNRKGAP
jgi:excisionase family DNA binding protein